MAGQPRARRGTGAAAIVRTCNVQHSMPSVTMPLMRATVARAALSQSVPPLHVHVVLPPCPSPSPPGALVDRGARGAIAQDRSPRASRRGSPQYDQDEPERARRQPGSPLVVVGKSVHPHQTQECHPAGTRRSRLRLGGHGAPGIERFVEPPRLSWRPVSVSQPGWLDCSVACNSLPQFPLAVYSRAARAGGGG